MYVCVYTHGKQLDNKNKFKPISNSATNLRYLGIHLIKNVQDLFLENYRIRGRVNDKIKETTLIQVLE